jgi:hypothetical protein
MQKKDVDQSVQSLGSTTQGLIVLARMYHHLFFQTS